MPNTNNKKQLIVKYLKKLIDFLEKRWNYKPQIYNTTLHSLAPRVLEDEKELERIKPYLNSLNQAVDTPDINNIALTGGYGSGKSTILKTFQHLHRTHYDFLNISLASFDKKGKPDDDLERKLEVSILQQMFYHVKPSRIPDSRFKRIINLSNCQLFTFSVGLLFWGLSTIILFKFDYINTLNPKLWKPDYTIDWVGFLTSVIFFGGVSLFVKSIYRLLLNSKINKLTIKGELELAESVDNKSVFNQHLEEILYFFERTEYNVVVIEDLDRFDSTDIFTKLREINILINNSESINRTVKFVYAIKDEMFKDKNERVKFFEFIIPVISFINPTNAKEQLTKLIENANFQEELSSDFTSDVVTFIDDIDMRLLINIFHEYQMYRIMLSNSLNQDKLFAMIVYKNLYPDDFGELQKRKGNLYDIFSNKAQYVEALTSELKNRIELIDARILQIENEEEKSIEELRAVYINALIPRFSGFSSFYVLNEYKSSVEVLVEKYFTALRKSTIQYYNGYYSGSVQNSGIRLQEIEKQVNSQFTYEEREQLLIDKHNNKINQLKVEKEKIKREIQEIEGYSIQELFTKINIENYAGAFKDNNLLRSLLINGYLDENYDDYISLFHEVNLTKNDFDFIRKIKSGSYLPFDYPLIRVENLLKDIQEKYFKRESILNYYLLSFLLKNEVNYEFKLGYFFGLLSIDGKNQFEFIKGYLKFEPTLEALFIKRLCYSKSNLWQYISEKSDEPSENVKQFLSLIFNHANKEDIYKLNSLKTLENYVSQMGNFFQFCADLNHPSTVQSFIKDRNIVFDRLDEPKISEFNQKTVFESIYQKNLYKINTNNIEKIVFGKTMTIEKTQLNTAHFSTIKSLNLKCLTDYIDANFGTYIDEVLLKLDNNTQEDEETLIHILNREDVSDEGKEQFIQKQRNLISELASISSNDIKSILLKHSKIEINWRNIWDYYFAINTNEEVLNTELSLNETFIQYLNTKQVYSVLSSQRLNLKDIEESVHKSMSNNLLQCNKLGIQSYTSLLDSLPYNYTSMNFNTLDIDKLEAIIKKKKITLTQSNITGLKEKGSDLHIRLLETYQLDLSSKLKTLELRSDDYIKLFKSSSVVSTVKLDVIQGLEDDFILEYKALIREIAQLLPDDGKVKMSFQVLSNIFKFLDSNDKKLAVLCNNLEYLKNEEVKTLILALGDNYEKIFQKKKRPPFSNSSNHLTLFENIGKRGLIKKYETFNNDKEIRVFALYD